MSDELAARVIQVIAKTQHLPPESITIDKTFAELKFDSLDGMNILFAIENEFDISIPDDQAVQIKSVREMVEGIEKLVAAKEAAQSRMTRRVAVTGIGVIAAPGSTRAAFWESLRNGRSAIRPMTLVPEGSLRFPNAAEVPDLPRVRLHGREGSRPARSLRAVRADCRARGGGRIRRSASRRN